MEMRGSEVSISVVKCSWMKCGELLQDSDDIDNIIRTLLEDIQTILIADYIFFRIYFYHSIYGCFPV
jgi:hypothetical protein